MPEPKLKLSREDDYDEENFIEKAGDEGNGTVLVVKNQAVIFRVRAHILTDEPVGNRVVDRRGHLWALNYMGEGMYELDLHDRTPREVMEES